MHRSPTARTRLYMEQVLEQTCRSLPNGGDHDVRAFVARRLADAAEDGWTMLGELGIIGRKALADYATMVHAHQQPESSSGRYPMPTEAAA